MVLTVGNYVNGGTARGQAYGVKLEVLAKLATIKTNPPPPPAPGTPINIDSLAVSCGNTLLHYISWELEKKQPELLSVGSSWEGVWAAAEVSFKQLEVDIKQLETQVERLRTELNNGVSKVLEEKGESVAGPLRTRINKFLSAADPRMAAIKRLQGEVTTNITTAMARYVL